MPDRGTAAGDAGVGAVDGSGPGGAGAPAWSGAVDPALTSRLHHRAHQPGLVRLGQARAVLARHGAMVPGVPLADALLRRLPRRPAGEVPVVAARPVPVPDAAGAAPAPVERAPTPVVRATRVPAPAASVPPTSVSPASVPPASVPPASVSPASVPPASGPRAPFRPVPVPPAWAAASKVPAPARIPGIPAVTPASVTPTAAAAARPAAPGTGPTGRVADETPAVRPPAVPPTAPAGGRSGDTPTAAPRGPGVRPAVTAAGPRHLPGPPSAAAGPPDPALPVRPGRSVARALVGPLPVAASDAAARVAPVARPDVPAPARSAATAPAPARPAPSPAVPDLPAASPLVVAPRTRLRLRAVPGDGSGEAGPTRPVVRPAGPLSPGSLPVDPAGTGTSPTVRPAAGPGLAEEVHRLVVRELAQAGAPVPAPIPASSPAAPAPVLPMPAPAPAAAPRPPRRPDAPVVRADRVAERPRRNPPPVDVGRIADAVTRRLAHRGAVDGERRGMNR